MPSSVRSAPGWTVFRVMPSARSDIRKFSIPPIQAGAVMREQLFAKLAGSTCGVIALIAPPGYGKTTALIELAARERRRVAWVSLDQWDDDPGTLLSDVAQALGRALDLDPALVDRFTAPSAGFPAARIRRLARAADQTELPFLLVLDDVHVLSDPSSIDVLATLITHLPAEARIVIAAREAPAIPLARLRTTGEFLQIGVPELAMDDQEASQLMHAAGVDLSDEAVSAVNGRSEGWPAGLYLIALTLRDSSGAATVTANFGGYGRTISDYVREEVLSRLPDEQTRFLLRSAILERLSPALCDVVVGTADSAAMLDRLERQNRFLVPLDMSGRWYRYHQLFRDVLLAELARREPRAMRDLHRRAAQWLETNGYPADAIDHAHAAGDTYLAARLVCDLARPYCEQGRLRTVQRWLAAFDDATVTAYPPLAAFSALVLGLVGDRAALRWLEIAQAATFDGPMPGRIASLQSMTSLVRAMLSPGGVEEMLVDARHALESDSADSPWRSGTLLLRSVALLLLGRVADARAGFDESLDAARADQANTVCIAHAELALIAAEAGEWENAADHVAAALARAYAAGIDDSGLQILPFAMSALVAMHNGEVQVAQEALTRAHRLRSESNVTLPWLGMQARILMARVHLAYGDVAGARAVLRDAHEIERRRPLLGVLGPQLDDVEARIREVGADLIAGSTSLTTAELRLLAFLPTYLTYRDIAVRLRVSPNTVKSQAMSIYRKLGASGRSGAINRARELRLLVR